MKLLILLKFTFPVVVVFGILFCVRLVLWSHADQNQTVAVLTISYPLQSRLPSGASHPPSASLKKEKPRVKSGDKKEGKGGKDQKGKEPEGRKKSGKKDGGNITKIYQYIES